MRKEPSAGARPPRRELLVLRHAKSAWDTDAAHDLARPLAARGERDVPRLGAWLASRGIVPDHVVCSPAVRARQTVELLRQALAGDVPAPRADGRIYEGDLPHLLEVLAECPREARRVLLVGHNPGLEILLRFLSPVGEERMRREKLLPTCALAHLAMPDDWTHLDGGRATVLDLVRPKDL
ncbi:MAG: histidine phosphatase family protein [Planctomycetota bacterium]